MTNNWFQLIHSVIHMGTLMINMFICFSYNKRANCLTNLNLFVIN